jgi:NAD+ synthase (glutamine-hydrolysing)
VPPQEKHPIALAQLNLWVGDIDGNVDKILESAHTALAQGASLLATPELALIGYPPDDLLLRTGMPDAIAEGLQRLKTLLPSGITVIVGYPEYAQDGLYNAATVLRDGQQIAHYRKQQLPNYGVFDERRHFKAGSQPCVFAWQGKQVGLTICEDAWFAHPTLQAKAAGAELLININASPYEQDKAAQRLHVLQQRVEEVGLPLFYVNCVGGQDEVVFDGGSLALDADGEVTFRAPQCVEEVFVLPAAGIAPEMPSIAVLYDALVLATRDYVQRNGFPGVLLGLSGGIDSALVAAIAVDALGADKVWCVSMPSRYTLEMSNDDARIQCERTGCRYEVLPIEAPFSAFNETLADLFAGKKVDLTEENLQSRCRGVLLMALSNKFGHMVLTTGNKSEMAVGYATLYGDMCGGFAPLKDVYKTTVFDLCRYRNSMGEVIPVRVIERPPSAELRPDQKDSDSLPPYEVLDAILQQYIEGHRSIEEIIALGFAESTVRRVAALVRRAEYKRRQAPPGPKVTARAFGRERRYPITAVYGDL